MENTKGFSGSVGSCLSISIQCPTPVHTTRESVLTKSGEVQGPCMSPEIYVEVIYTTHLPT